MRIRLIGAGRVGAPLGAWFMSKGHHVKFVETNTALLEQVLTGTLPWEEPYLNETLQDEVEEFHITDDEPCDWTFISVGTPVIDGKPLLRNVENIVRELEPETNVVLRSTVAPGTCDTLAKKFNRVIWHAPERLLLGRGLDELDELPQIIGATEPASLINTNEFMRAFGRCFPKFVPGTAVEAECAKVANNIMRYIEFAAGTELSELFEVVGANNRVVRGMMTNGYKRGRISFPSFVGSYCLDKDWQMLSHVTKTTPKLASAAADYNLNLPKRLLNSIPLNGQRVVVLGLTYKPGLDDCRESPSLTIISELLKYGNVDIRVHDPLVDVAAHLMEYFGGPMEGLSTITGDLQAEVRKADVVVLATAHDDYCHTLEFKDEATIIDPSGNLASNSNFIWEA